MNSKVKRVKNGRVKWECKQSCDDPNCKNKKQHSARAERRKLARQKG